MTLGPGIVAMAQHTYFIFGYLDAYRVLYAHSDLKGPIVGTVGGTFNKGPGS